MQFTLGVTTGIILTTAVALWIFLGIFPCSP